MKEEYSKTLVEKNQKETKTNRSQYIIEMIAADVAKHLGIEDQSNYLTS